MSTQTEIPATAIQTAACGRTFAYDASGNPFRVVTHMRKVSARKFEPVHFIDTARPADEPGSPWFVVGASKLQTPASHTPMKTTSALITDDQTLKGAKSQFGHEIPVYDDGFGPLFIHRDSTGISGIVRAQTWSDAYEICEDEFFPAGDEDAAEEMERIEAMPEGEDRNHAQACWDEAYGYRNNSRAMEDGSTSSIYAKDLNGDALDLLTPELLASLEITLEIEDA